jgi:exosortase A-associated hydrolase 2
VEEHFFFTNRGEPIFAVMHHPGDYSRGGVVFCYPFAEERQEAHRVLVNFARILAENGFSVLRFDYRGTGDSHGEFGDYNLSTRTEDVLRAVEILKERAGVEKVALFGLRLGATIALLAARNLKHVELLILWAPVLNLKTYLHQFLRGHLAMQMVTEKKITVTREALINELMQGNEVNVQGYHLSGEFYVDAIQIDPLKGLRSGEYPILIVDIEARGGTEPLLRKMVEDESAHRKSRYSMVNEEPFWLEKKYYIPDSEVFFRTTLDWMNSIT